MSWDYLPDNCVVKEALADLQAQCQRSDRGTHNRFAGEYFEKLIEASLMLYKGRGMAEIEKTPEPMKPLGKPNHKGQFLACYTKSAQPDFKGTLEGGYSVVFEAKHTDGDRIEYSRLTKEQIERMESHYKLGAFCFVMVSFNLEHFCRIPWAVWRDMKALYGRKYITFEECGRYKVPNRSGMIMLFDGICRGGQCAEYLPDTYDGEKKGASSNV